jgi:hypothetical protein
MIKNILIKNMYISIMDREVVDDIFQLTVFNKVIGEGSGFVWKLGNTYRVNQKRFICSKIMRDDNSFYFTGVACWAIYLKCPNTDEEFRHMDYENAAVEIKRNAPKHLI